MAWFCVIYFLVNSIKLTCSFFHIVQKEISLITVRQPYVGTERDSISFGLRSSAGELSKDVDSTLRIVSQICRRERCWRHLFGKPRGHPTFPSSSSDDMSCRVLCFFVDRNKNLRAN